MKTKSLTPIILAVFFAISPLFASADSFHDIAIQARAKYAAAQEGWQRGLAELVTRTDTNFQEIATIQRDLQLAYIEQSTARFRYLLEHDSKRIILTNGVSQFANFDWSDEDTKAITKSDPKYIQLQKRILELETKNDKESDWPKFRVWFRDTLSKSGDYKTLLSDFQVQQKAVEDLLGGSAVADSSMTQAQLDQIRKDFGVVVEVRDHKIIVGTAGLATKEQMSQIEDALHKVYGNDFTNYTIVHLVD